MPRDARAYLSDIITSCEAITSAVDGLGLSGYLASRLVRSSVEREFIIIGEAMSVLSRRAPEVFSAVTQARRIVDFRNQLTHEYQRVDDEAVWVIVDRDVAPLREQCAKLLAALDAAEGAD